MKKTILLLSLAIGTLGLTSCSRGYGCPYTMEMEVKKKNIETNDIECIERELEVLETVLVAD